MLRLYLRAIFNKLQKTLFFLKDYKKLHHRLVKSAIYKRKIKKVLKINQNRLFKKIKIINQANDDKTSKSMNCIL